LDHFVIFTPWIVIYQPTITPMRKWSWYLDSPWNSLLDTLSLEFSQIIGRVFDGLEWGFISDLGIYRSLHHQVISQFLGLEYDLSANQSSDEEMELILWFSMKFWIRYYLPGIFHDNWKGIWWGGRWWWWWFTRDLQGISQFLSSEYNLPDNHKYYEEMELIFW
jgi:hypothetical protein